MDWGPNKTGLDTSVPQQAFRGWKISPFHDFEFLHSVKCD